MRVFLGVTGASGAPYAKRLLEALVSADCDVGVCASKAGIQVLATELYREPSLERDEVLARFVGDAGDAVTLVGIDDYTSRYASGSARVDGYVICPCSMSTVGTLAAGAMANLIHRAASVALKEGAASSSCRARHRSPRSTCAGWRRSTRRAPSCSSRRPGFYHGAESVDDLVNFVVARCLDQLGIDNALVQRWGTRRDASRPERSIRRAFARCSTGSRPSTTR